MREENLKENNLKETNVKETKFKGFDIAKTSFTIDKFTCKSKIDDDGNPCSNFCEIQRIRIDGDSKPLYYGGRCEKYEVKERKGKGKGIPDLFQERMELLLGDFDEKEEKNGRITIGIPRGLTIFYQYFPYWRTFLQELGFHVVISSTSDRPLVTKSLGIVTAETCFPVELMHGHVKDLLDKDIDYVFTPFVVNQESKEGDPTNNTNCPWVQTYPFMVRGAVGAKNYGDRMLIPTLHFRYPDTLKKELSTFMKKKFGISKSKIHKAIQLANNAQMDFVKAVVEKGRAVLDNLPKDKVALVIIGRPYNTNDPGLNLNIVKKLMNLNVLPIPIDYLPLHEEDINQDYTMMYWPNGQKILSASRIVAKNKGLHLVYMGNFRCGPDSFLSHYVSEELKGKPYLQIEVDEHSADAGMITRYEAFLDSLKGYKKVHRTEQEKFRPGAMRSSTDTKRVLYIPYMNDNAHSLAAAIRSTGMESEVLPMQNNEDIELGRKYTSSRECFPMTATTGNFLRKLMEPGVDPKKISFFMPDHNGPCRFGQYNKFQRIIFDRLGFNEAEIISPANDGAYEDISDGQGKKLRFRAWKGFVAIDLLRKMQQERRPYEVNKGDTNKVYDQALKDVITSIEQGADDLPDVLERLAENFKNINVVDGPRKPVIPIIGEIFMRDNTFCNGSIVEKLEALGAETIIAPFAEWITYSSYRYWRDSMWKKDIKGLFKSKVQEYSQKFSAHKLHQAVGNAVEFQRDIPLKDMLEKCDPYIHKDYDGDPALAFGAAAGLMDTEISGIVNVLPFACMPGTFIQSVSHVFRKDHNNIPWEDIAFDGQDNMSTDTRLQAFMHQAKQYSKDNGFDKPRDWPV